MAICELLWTMELENLTKHSVESILLFFPTYKQFMWFPYLIYVLSQSMMCVFKQLSSSVGEDWWQAQCTDTVLAPTGQDPTFQHANIPPFICHAAMGLLSTQNPSWWNWTNWLKASPAPTACGWRETMTYQLQTQPRPEALRSGYKSQPLAVVRAVGIFPSSTTFFFPFSLHSKPCFFNIGSPRAAQT